MDSSSVLIEEQKLQSEPKYRAYMANIDKALKNFEYSSEWADLISALGKLNKAISSNTQYQVIPRRIKISKRLAQCMHPALPSGVHLKALETYDVIFSKTGAERLATEMFIYSSGLFPLLGYAAMNVRPTLLAIYEKFFVPLGERLRPALSGFLSGVIPGYESGLDHFERTNQLLQQVCAAVQPAYFYTCLWECVSTNASIRLPAISYLLDHFNRKCGMHDQLALMGKHKAVLMAGLCACLNDPVILVQRNTLEFLLIGFPMHTGLLRRADFVRLVTNGLNTILRRDMSLNRRLYAWLLGTEVIGHRAKDRPSVAATAAAASGDQSTTLERVSRVAASYFEQHSKEVLIEALRCTLQQSLQSRPVDLTPYRILVSLLDKVEIGPVVLDHVLCDVIRAMWLARGNEECLKSANLLFATFDPAYIWNFMTMCYGRACAVATAERQGAGADGGEIAPTSPIGVASPVASGEPRLAEVCALTEFLLESLALEAYHETTRLYLPRVFLAIVRSLTGNVAQLTADEVHASLRLCMKIVSRVQPMIQSPKARARLLRGGLADGGGAGTTTGGGAGGRRPVSVSGGAGAEAEANGGGAGSLEKSKSDSKINQTENDDEPIRRSNSNHAIKKSPKKTKKSKSYTRLLELNRDISSSADPAMPSAVSTPDLDLSQQMAAKKAKSKRFSPSMKLRNLKGRSTPDIKIDINEPSPSSPGLTGSSPTDDASVASASALLLTTVGQHQPDWEEATEEHEAAEEERQRLAGHNGTASGGANQQTTTIQEYSIVEQCIKQYEEFYYAYLLSQVLHIQGGATAAPNCPPPAAPAATEEEIVRATVCPERQAALAAMFATLQIAEIGRTQRLHSLLHRSLGQRSQADAASAASASSSGASSSTDDQSPPSPLSAFSDAAHQQPPDAETARRLQRLHVQRLPAALRQSVRLASTLLVEMSTFPNYTQTLPADDADDADAEHNGHSATASSALAAGRQHPSIPPWLQCLALVACYARSDRSLQLATCATLFDMITLIRTQLDSADVAAPGGGGGGGSGSVRPLCMIPLMRHAHVQRLERRTRVLHIVTSALWDHLGEDGDCGDGDDGGDAATADPAHVAALLYQLNAAVRSGLVERVIGQRMANAHQQWSGAAAAAEQRLRPTADGGGYVAERLRDVRLMCAATSDQRVSPLRYCSESQRFRKFELLWEYGRHSATDPDHLRYASAAATAASATAAAGGGCVGGAGSGCFESTLMLVLDQLAQPAHVPARTFVARWLQESLLRGDLQRLVAPLLRILFAAGTKRVSVKHAHLLWRPAAATGGAGLRFGEDEADGHGGEGGRRMGAAGASAAGPGDREVYAISSEDGRIKYHHHPAAVATEAGAAGDKKRSPIRQLQKKFFGVSLGGGSGGGRSKQAAASGSAIIAASAAAVATADTSATNISLIVNPLDSSSDLDAWESEETTEHTGGAGSSPVGSAPAAAANRGGAEESASAAGSSLLLRRRDDDEYYSSCEEETDNDDNDDVDVDDDDDDADDDDADHGNDVSYDHSESDSEETRDVSSVSLATAATAADIASLPLPAAASSGCQQPLDMKRFSGDCERVTEMLSQHDRTKNRKQYRVTKAAAAAAAAAAANGIELCAEASTPAEEYFSSMSVASDGAQPLTDEERHAVAVALARDSSARHSCTSKTSSTESTKSRRRPAKPAAQQRRICEARNDSLSGGSDAEQQTTPSGSGGANNMDSVDSGVVVGGGGTSSSGPASVSKGPAGSGGGWSSQTEETVEQSKRNAEILRKKAATELYGDGLQFMRRSNLVTTEQRPAPPRQVERLHPFHTHMLLYCGVYDTKQVLYSFQTLRNVIASDCRTFLYLAMTTGLPTGAPLRQLLVRHRKSTCGKGFTGPVANTEFAQAYRGCMHLDVLITGCLYYVRSYLRPDATTSAAGNAHAEDDEIVGNARIQLASAELLTMLCAELIAIVRDMGRQLAAYVYDLLAKCKLQKIALHCVLSCVHSFTARASASRAASASATTYTEQLLAFNEPHDERMHVESLQLQLLRLMSAIIRLEYEVTARKGDDVPPGNGSGGSGAGNASATGNSASTPGGGGGGGGGSPTRLGPSTPTNVKYLPNCPISQQPMFLSAVLSALQCDTLRPLHSKWTDLITSSLNCFTFGSLTNIVISVIHQLCANCDQISRQAAAADERATGQRSGAVNATPPPPPPPAYIAVDYVCAQVQAITVLCHYCLLDAASTPAGSLQHLHGHHQAAGSAAANSTSTAGQHSFHHYAAPISSGGQLLHNFVHAILSPAASAAGLGGGGSGGNDQQPPTRGAQLLAARNAVLSHLPVIVASIARLWDTQLGQQRTVRQQIGEFLSPVFRQHGSNFLAAIAVTWQQRAAAGSSGVQVPATTNPTTSTTPSSTSESRSLPQACPSQLSLVRLISSIRVMPMDTFVATLHAVVKSPPQIHHPPTGLSIECSALELFYFYMRQTPPIQLADCWPALLPLLRDGLALQPPAQFVLLAVLNEFVLRAPQMPFTDRKDLRDLHDVCARLVEALSQVAGARLEQTTWLRRNLAVKEDVQSVHQQLQQLGGGGGSGGGHAGSAGTNNGGFGGHHSAGDLDEAVAAAGRGEPAQSGAQLYSVQAQSVMAAVLANLLDVAYGYQDKDKVVTIITTLMYNITPYLRNHTRRNVPAFRACSQLLASLSGFQYTRKAWRKDMVDLLLDAAFFQMDVTCLPSWKTILDNLMTYDNTTFRELMGRVSLTQTGGLNIFTSREQEYEQRALLLKRLAFVIFCSERNQYHKYMPEIQEQLANSLRLPSVVPAVQAAVFLCFRVLLLRMSPDHVTSLWPTIIAEMVQVFLAIEQELKSDNEEFSQQLRALSGMDAPFNQHHLNHWRNVQLETAKLLELGCVLPATNLPHFQMYRWAFVGSQYDGPSDILSSSADGGALDHQETNGQQQHQSGAGGNRGSGGSGGGCECGNASCSSSVFIPHVQRIAHLMDVRYTRHSPTTRSAPGTTFLTLTCQSIADLQDLYAFFSTLGAFWPPANFDTAERDVDKCLAEIETVLADDFLERMPGMPSGSIAHSGSVSSVAGAASMAHSASGAGSMLFAPASGGSQAR